METSNKQIVHFRDLGNMEYQHAWDLQEQLLKENVAVKTAIRNRQSAMAAVEGEVGVENEEVILDTNHYLLFVEHPPVYTLGKSGDMSNVLISEEERAAKGISFYNTNRGGDITFHGREQLVGYPILDLDKIYTDLGRYLRGLEEVIILTMAEYGLKGERSPGETGVWLDASIPGKERKICAMGIRCSRWITMHGFAFNVNTDLNYFNYIIPCGIQNKQVTSLEKELGRKLDLNEVKEKVKRNFEKVFMVELIS
ncbi:lipoyl(octanoyl) transferase [Niastella yeongjuensis]|uniref:Octanoyltransferase n=1 Tax=Niastella yeongjuensis TaxID=354355 RepID=A0A1V9EAD5_9BACT|nr:lipoyl(octanoyl) transferase LipB [Niastella yeongjuensis]OQP43097.1 lipoyl(octanoyl) transferase [Niastella yeongjuensis]SEO66320.1 lipoyl(octanoyl) transferase [Niastella yeongjuensis]